MRLKAIVTVLASLLVHGCPDSADEGPVLVVFDVSTSGDGGAGADVSSPADWSRPPEDTQPDAHPSECSGDEDCKGLSGAGGPCRKGVCNAETGLCELATDEDGTPCTLDDQCSIRKCKGGVCEAVGWVECGDDDVCTEDGCEPGEGCTHAAIPGCCHETAECDDGNSCTEDACVDHACLHAPKGACCAADKDCNDGSGCTADVCESVTGLCFNEALPDGSSCDDGSKCTDGDTCTGGVCAGVPTPGCCAMDIDCDDGNSCSSDICNSASGLCMYVAFAPGAACEDGNLCTQGDVCSAGVCKPGAGIPCPSADPCKLGQCVPATGKCTYTARPDGTPCSDDNPCTSPDTCTSGTCSGKPVYACCKADPDCDDANACTADLCELQAGICSYESLDGADCDDGNACTSGDSCKGDKCAGSAPVSCEPKPCALVSCNAATGECEYSTAPDGTSCSDGDPCTGPDKCAAGACAGAPISGCCANGAECDDGKPCTTDSCAAGKCVHVPLANESPCEDGDPCTTSESCLYGVCAGAPKTCKPAGPCQKAACDPATGECVQEKLPDGSACSDGDSCTGPDACLSGKCAGAPVAGCCKSNADCDDGNPCTQDACSVGAGTCMYVAADGKPCDDGNACTKIDVCESSTCVGKWQAVCPQYDPCNVGSCNPATGDCVYTAKPDGTGCNDGQSCTDNDKCTKGACGGTGKNYCKPCSVDWKCADGDPCTVDTCDFQTGENKGMCKYDFDEDLCGDD